MHIQVRRGRFGPMNGAAFALGIAAGLLSLSEPLFRPVALATVVLGAVLAAILRWRNRRHQRATLSPGAEGSSPERPLSSGPK